MAPPECGKRIPPSSRLPSLSFFSPPPFAAYEAPAVRQAGTRGPRAHRGYSRADGSPSAQVPQRPRQEVLGNSRNSGDQDGSNRARSPSNECSPSCRWTSGLLVGGGREALSRRGDCSSGTRARSPGRGLVWEGQAWAAELLCWDPALSLPHGVASCASTRVPAGPELR